ncbi:MAG: hypothetical protein PHO78_05175 [Methanomicrobium sp.]|nr:hypothetical protein [Methanomicrobium sp.]
MTSTDIDAFFRNEGICVFTEVNIEDIPAPDRDYISEFLPGAGSVFIFAKEIPSPVYRLSPKEKTREMLVIAESLDKTAKKLSALLNAEGILTRPVPLYLPVTITKTNIRGLVRLKQTAEAGGLGVIGKSSLLITPQYGPRVFLSGVVTTRHIQKSGNVMNSLPVVKNPDENLKTCAFAAPLCTGCGLCIKNCPGEVFGSSGVDAFKCLTIRPWVPPVIIPIVKWILKRQMLLGFAAPFAPWFARFATMPCSKCVTGCQRF